MNLSAEERKRIMVSITGVGLRKPIGYLPLNTITNVLEISADTLADDARSRGLAAVTLTPDRCCINSGALYVYDYDALAELLLAFAETLSGCGLSTNPDEFVLQIAANWLDSSHAARPIIAAAFAEAG